MKKVQFVTTTATFASKGKEVLKSNGIPCEIKKVQGGTAAGCLFGITVGEAFAAKAKRLLLDTDVRIILIKEV